MSVHAGAIERRAQVLFEEHRTKVYAQTDRLFACLMVFQWAAGIAAAMWVSPRIWAGDSSRVHLHVWAAVILGGLIALPALAMALRAPGKTMTRYVVSVSQMLFSALLIHLSGGRIETHFHVFGSLAFLSFYRDWKVLIPATVVVALDHWIRGVYWPQSVYGVLYASPWRWIEHAGWVFFEDVFLFFACLKSVSEMREIAQRRAELEMSNQVIEQKVIERTQALSVANQSLEEAMRQRTRLEAQVIQSEKMSAVGQLAAGVAHEINNPLAVILGFSEGITRTLDNSHPLEMPLRSIEREALRCKGLVQDLLSFSRTSDREFEPLDLGEVVRASLSLFSPRAKVANIKLEFECPPSLPAIRGNRNQLQQVLVNLVNNALDAMPAGGTLTLRIQASDGRVELQVQDTGVGMSESVRRRIFEPFFTTKDVGKGTGLGLSLVYDIVQKHGGEVSVTSREGKGSTFHVSFVQGAVR